jgi:hypothetical protein
LTKNPAFLLSPLSGFSSTDPLTPCPLAIAIIPNCLCYTYHCPWSLFTIAIPLTPTTIAPNKVFLFLCRGSSRRIDILIFFLIAMYSPSSLSNFH